MAGRVHFGAKAEQIEQNDPRVRIDVELEVGEVDLDESVDTLVFAHDLRVFLVDQNDLDADERSAWAWRRGQTRLTLCSRLTRRRWRRAFFAGKTRSGQIVDTLAET